MYRLLLLLIISNSFCLLSAQQSTTINLPPSSLSPTLPAGTMAYDIIYDNASGKMFVYSTDKILVFSASSHQYLGEIPLNQYGKFNPITFNTRLHAVDKNVMTINNDGAIKLLYAITPNLHIKAININDITQTWDIIPHVDVNETLEDLFQKQNGKIVIKYDERTNRLFLLVSGKDIDDNCTGNFHARTSFFGIYDIDNNITPNSTDYIDLYHSEINLSSDPYKDQINDFVFNTNANFYYITRLSKPYGKIEIWEITPNNPNNKVQIVKTINIDGAADNYYKFGKMLYVNNNAIHKIIVLPYRYPPTSVEEPKFCVIDGNHSNAPNSVEYDIIDSPSKKILDAVFLEGDNNQINDLILSYAPDNDEIPNSNNHGTDIAVFHFNGTSFVPRSPFTYNTNSSISTSNKYDINSSFKLLKTNSNTVLIGKKDEIVKLSYNGSSYTYNAEFSGESNFFNGGASGAGSSFIINAAANGIETFFNSNHNNTIRTGYPVYHITANNDGSKLYYFNKLSAYNTGLYVHGGGQPVNINNQQTSIENGIETAIGDCIYNSYTNQLLVSENSDFGTGNSAKIKVYNDDQNNTWHSTITLPVNVQFAKTMFIAPNKKLYVMANMHRGMQPIILIYDATNYSPLQTYQLEMPDFEDFDYYSAHFNYNSSDQNVYLSIHPTEITLDPYQTETNSMFDFDEPFDTENKGLFIKIKENQITTYENIIYPGKIICPDTENKGDKSQYNGKVFVIGKQFSVYNLATDIVDNYTESFNDITYSSFHDKLFAIKDVSDECNSDRQCEIWSIDYNNDNLVFLKLGHFAGQAASIFANPYNDKVYIYNKTDDAKLGETEIRLYSFDLADGFLLSYNELGMTSFYPELDHCSDYHYYFYNITTPYINPYNNYIYLPNGGHSSVSRVTFEPNEALFLNPGINWISVPRHTRPIENSWTLVEDVFNQSNFTEGYTYLELLHWHVDNTLDQMYIAQWGNPEWLFDPNINDVKRTFSTRGYKLNLAQPGNSNNLIMSGDVQDPLTYINLYAYKDNWVGYFIYEQQDIFDALASVVDDIYSITHQDYFCYFGDVMDGPSDAWPTVPGHSWHCSQPIHNIKYGEMVEIKSRNTIDGFAWNHSGNPPRIIDDIRDSEYFTYAEQASYTPIMIELDSTANPLEIGAFVNDSCIGACTVFPNDTIVGIRAYMGGQAGEITFEQYDGTKSGKQNAISNYYVYNKKSGFSEKRKINTTEKSNHFFVSFKQTPTQTIANTKLSFNIYPNPVNNMLNIVYKINKKAMVTISVFDSYGRCVALIYNDTQPKGSYNTQWSLLGKNNKKLPKGLYIIKLKVDNNVISKKLVVN